MGIKPDKNVMQAAIQVAEQGQTPFGAALGMGGEVFATAVNQAIEKNDPTAHAEIEVIRKISEQTGKRDLSGFTLYTTCEPCPMCMSAAIWANIKCIVYGCGIPIVSAYMNQIEVRADEIISKSLMDVELIKNFMDADCEALLEKYS